MFRIPNITDYPNQQFTIPIVNYENAVLTLKYRPSQYGWFMDLVWGSFQAYGERVSVSPNILRQYQNRIPFGIAVNGIDRADPLNADSWVNNNGMYILDESDVADIEELYYVRT